MGSVCYQKDVALAQSNDPEKQTIKIVAVDALKQINFSFTTQKLIHVSADLLLLINDTSTNIRKNDHFQKLPMQGAKLEEHLKANLNHKKEPSQFTTFNIIIPTLNFSRVSVLFCEIWKQGQHNDAQFREVLRAYFDSISDQNVKSMVITEPSSELGAHLQRTIKRILREIVRMKKKPERIQFCCLNEESKEIFANGVQQNKEDIQKSFGSISDNDGSVYY